MHGVPVKPKLGDYPLTTCRDRAERLLADSKARGVECSVFQKFTCASCGSRQTMAMANAFYTTGECEACGAMTDIRAKGCNFAAVFGPLATILAKAETES